MTVDYLVKKIENKKPVDLTEGSLALSKATFGLMNQEIEVKVDNVQIEVSTEEIEVKVDGETVVKIPTSTCWETLIRQFRKKTN